MDDDNKDMENHWNLELIEEDKSSEEEKKEETSKNETKNNLVVDNEYGLIVMPDNLPFSKMKQLMIIVSWNPWDIVIQVLWNEMKVSEKWLNEIKNLIQE